MASKCSSADDLVASLNLSNNGYLFAPSVQELEVAGQHPDVFSIRRGQIHFLGRACAHPRQPEPSMPRALDDGIDYEGAILARQEADQRYW